MEENPKQLNYIQAFRWIYARLQSHRRKQFWVLFAGMSISALLETATLGVIAFFASAVTDPEVVLGSRYLTAARQVMGPGFMAGARDLITVTGGVMLVMMASKNAFKALINYWITRFGVGIEAFFGEGLLNGFLRLPYTKHLKANSADFINAVNWRRFLGRGFFQPCLNIMNNLLMVLIMVVALFSVQPLISVIVCLVLGSTAGFIFTVVRRRIDKAATVARDYMIRINKETTMAIQGIKDVKISQKEDGFVQKFILKARPLSRISGVQEFYVQSPVLILETVGFAMLYLAIYAMLVLTETSTAYITGSMALLAVTAWKAIPAANQILGNFTTVRRSLPYIASQTDYFHLIESEPLSLSGTNVPGFGFEDRIRFKNVCFAYNDQDNDVIHHLDFEIKKGETIGIIGRSGAGKSTVVDLLIGLLTPDRGVLEIDGVPLDRERMPGWLSITGYVAQSPYIYDGTIAENVAFGMDVRDTDRERVEECCTMASMDDFMQDMPRGIDTVIGERGLQLSGGQRQRVAIARALYHHPRILIFDEATSSLDTQSEKAIQKTIYSLKGTHTLIIIAHRLSTVKDCDKVIWLEKGHLKMTGPPETVINLYDRAAGDNVAEPGRGEPATPIEN